MGRELMANLLFRPTIRSLTPEQTREAMRLEQAKLAYERTGDLAALEMNIDLILRDETKLRTWTPTREWDDEAETPKPPPFRAPLLDTIYE